MVLLAALLAACRAAQAQQQAQKDPHIGYVYPAGGQQGTTFAVTVGGEFLEGADAVQISGQGVTAEVIEYVKPLTPQQATQLRDQLKELLERRRSAFGGGLPDGSRPSTRPATRAVWTADDEKLFSEIRQKLATFVRRPSSPAIAETVVVEVTLAADAAPGQRELRLKTPAGLTNPLIFCIGQLPEFSQKPTHETTAREEREGTQTQEREMSITLPAIVNGQIMPGSVDHYHFEARQGHHLVIAASARALIPYLADAVPGWFEAAVSLHDAKGNELAYDDHFRFDPDPVLYFEVPQDGQYTIDIKDALYRGRQDFVYRIEIGELPFITGIFPLGGKAGALTTVTLSGWNLPAGQLTQDVTNKAAGVVPVVASQGGVLSNAKPFMTDTLPECVEAKPSDRPDAAQFVRLPIIINGRIEHPGDWHVFRFEGRAGQHLVAEVYARRLGSPLDSVLKLTNAQGKQIAFNDDYEDKGAGLVTHQADSWLSVTLPAEGAYYIHLGDAQDKGGPEYAYRLRISDPRPDFELRAFPSNINVRPGGTVAFAVCAIRRDGFSGEIDLALKDAPPGFTLAGAAVPANQDEVRLTLTAPPTFQDQTIDLHVEGRAIIYNKQVVHEAVPAEEMMQAFAYKHLVPADELAVSVVGRAINRNSMQFMDATPVRIPAGGVARLYFAVPRSRFMGQAQVQLELSDPPDGISVREVSPANGGVELVLQCDAEKIKPGLAGNLIVDAFVERTVPSPKDKTTTTTRRVPLGTLPAIPFQIVSR